MINNNIIFMVFGIIIMCLGVVGNIMVAVVILKTKDMRNSTNIFLLNLSLADVLVLLVCTPPALVQVNSKPETWVLGREMCKAVPFVEQTVAHVSVLTILAISFERYYAICKPLKAGYICTKTRATLICLLAWFIAAISTSPVFAITQFDMTEYYDGTLVFVCFNIVDNMLTSLFYMASVVFFFIFPLIILICVYALISKTLMEHPMGELAPHTSDSQNAIKYRKQVMMMLGVVVAAFFICLLPFRALTLWILLSPVEALSDIGIENYYNILYFARVMFYANSALNPILYNVMSSKFRGGFSRLCGFKVLRKFKGKPESTTKTSSQQIENIEVQTLMPKDNMRLKI